MGGNELELRLGMSDAEIIIRLGLVAVLCGYLYFKHWQRTRQLIERLDERHWTGASFNASQISARVQRVRHDYLAELHPSSSCCRRSLVAVARRAVGHLAYFRDREPEQQTRLTTE